MIISTFLKHPYMVFNKNKNKNQLSLQFGLNGFYRCFGYFSNVVVILNHWIEEDLLIGQDYASYVGDPISSHLMNLSTPQIIEKLTEQQRLKPTLYVSYCLFSLKRNIAPLPNEQFLEALMSSMSEDLLEFDLDLSLERDRKGFLYCIGIGLKPKLNT